MLEVEEALAEVLRHAKPLPQTDTSLGPSTLGRVLAEDVRAENDSPPFDKSLRDGYAVRASDCASLNGELRIVAEIAAGAVPTAPIRPGECARIFTGAPMPEGADAVVMQEDTEPVSDGRVRITDASVKPRQWVFARGTEMRAGDVILPAGTVLNPAALGVLASLGRRTAALYSRPNVHLLSTGNELVEPGETLTRGQIYNSNGPMLAALVMHSGGSYRSLGIVRDNRDETQAMMESALEETDLLLIAGGVSVGKYDLVPAVLEDLGVAVHFRQVRMKPGKPLLFGTKGETLVFGLPGNPVSAFVCFELFVRPALRILSGHAEAGPLTTSLPIAESLSVANDRPTYHPAKLEVGESGWRVRPLSWLGAPDLRGLQPADALLVLPPGETRVAAGEAVTVVLL
jgi:molybdopterin molybdotransferase